MTLVEFVPPTPHPLWKLCPQMGITDVIVKVNPELTGLADPWRLSTLRSIVERLKVEGLNVVGLEGDPFDMTPIKEYGGRKEREEKGGAPSRCAMANSGAGSSTSLVFAFFAAAIFLDRRHVERIAFETDNIEADGLETRDD